MPKQRKAKKKTAKRRPRAPSAGTPNTVPAEQQPPPAPQAKPLEVTPYPRAGKKITDFENTLRDQKLIAAEPEPEKRRPGRPRKPQADEPPPSLSEDVIRNAIAAPFDVWAVSQKVPALELTSAESKSISAPVKQLLDYYLPEMPAITIAWVSLAVSSYAIMTTRLTALKQIRDEKKSNLPPETAPPGRTTQSPPQQAASNFPKTNDMKIQHE